MNNNETLKQRALKVIPNGMYGHMSTALQSPRTPQFYERAEGTYLWDYDGKRYIDYICAFGPVLFGYGNEAIDTAYRHQLAQVDTATGPSERMIDLSEALVDQVSHSQWAMPCKNGTDATTMALMSCRAHRGKRKILLADGAYHGASNWCTPVPTGTLEDERAHFITYEYNSVASLKRAVEAAGDDLAGVFATPFKHEVFIDQVIPSREFAQTARSLCDKHDALLVVDDVRAGFRLSRDCSWQSLGVAPDLSAWGKAIANGHALSCLLGSDRARAAAESIFVTGSFWFSSASMAASLKTLELINETDYLEKTVRLGQMLREGLESLAQTYGVPISQTGPVQMPLIMLETANNENDVDASIAFADALLEHGVLFHPFHNMFFNAAMSEADIEQTLDAANSVLHSFSARSVA